MLVAGMGARGARWLAAAGVESRAELARQDPDELLRRLGGLTGPDPPPSAAEVRVWVRKARNGPPVCCPAADADA
jgi:hypothetical protein